MGSLKYNLEESQYLEDNWGVLSVATIAKNLNRTVGGIINKKHRLGLGAFLDNGEYITVHQLFLAMGRSGSGGMDHALNNWLKKGFPMKKKRIHNCSFNIVYLNDFWKWAKEYRVHINFAKFKENALGGEPEWVKEQRKADVAFAKYKLTPWTNKEDNHLRSLLKLYKYTYKELSLAMFRTEGAIKQRMVDLVIMERPLRENPHSIWSDKQVEIMISMYNKGYKSDVIKEYIDKSSQAIGGKIERLIKDGYMVKRK